MVGECVTDFRASASVVDTRAVGGAGAIKQFQSVNFWPFDTSGDVFLGESQLHLLPGAHRVAVDADFKRFLAECGSDTEQSE